MRLSQLKAKAVQRPIPSAHYRLGSGAAMVDGRQLGKPGDFDKAFWPLKCRQGHGLQYRADAARRPPAPATPRRADVQTMSTASTGSATHKITAYLRDKPLQLRRLGEAKSLGIALMNASTTQSHPALIGLPADGAEPDVADEGIDVLRMPAAPAPLPDYQVPLRRGPEACSTDRWRITAPARSLRRRTHPDPRART